MDAEAPSKLPVRESPRGIRAIRLYRIPACGEEIGTELGTATGGVAQRGTRNGLGTLAIGAGNGIIRARRAEEGCGRSGTVEMRSGLGLTGRAGSSGEGW
jgi:hypothetical protein